MKTALTEFEIETVLQAHPDWKLDAGKLIRDWTFDDFAAAMRFVNRIATLAEQAGHHPDIDIRYNRVRLALVSHDAGGVTKRDASMVETIDLQHEA